MHKPAHRHRHKHRQNHKGEHGFAIYLMLGFILLVTFSLTSMGNLMIRQNQQQFDALTNAKDFRQAHQSLQIGLMRLKGQAVYLAADEVNYRLNIGATDAAMSADRTACLTGRGAFTQANAAFYLASLPRQQEGSRNRYFIRDISGTTLPRQFEIYGCALRDGIARLAHGVWQFDAATQTFILQRIEGF